MSLISLQNMLLEKLQEQNYNGVKGARLSVYLPVQEGLLNSILNELITNSDGMKDFQSLTFSDLNDNEFIVAINHKKINKTIRCLVHPVSNNKYSEPVLTVEFLEGIRFYEKIALKSAITFQKSWKWFKSKFSDGKEGHKSAGSAIDISSSSITINFADLLRQQGLEYLNPLITWEEFSTRENKLIIDLSIKM